jgi:hypothetical protein
MKAGVEGLEAFAQRRPVVDYQADWSDSNESFG